MAIDYGPLWRVLEGAPSLKEIEKRLFDLSDGDLRSAGAAFIDARTELIDALTLHGEPASEDTLDDVAGVLVLEGPSAFHDYIAGTRAWPNREEWGNHRSPLSVFDRAVDERLGVDILDLWEELV